MRTQALIACLITYLQNCISSLLLIKQTLLNIFSFIYMPYIDILIYIHTSALNFLLLISKVALIRHNNKSTAELRIPCAGAQELFRRHLTSPPP